MYGIKHAVHLYNYVLITAKYINKSVRALCSEKQGALFILKISEREFEDIEPKMK